MDIIEEMTVYWRDGIYRKIISKENGSIKFRYRNENFRTWVEDWTNDTHWGFWALTAVEFKPFVTVGVMVENLLSFNPSHFSDPQNIPVIAISFIDTLEYTVYLVDNKVYGYIHQPRIVERFNQKWAQLPDVEQEFCYRTLEPNEDLPFFRPDKFITESGLFYDRIMKLISASVLQTTSP